MGAARTFHFAPRLANAANRCLNVRKISKKMVVVRECFSVRFDSIDSSEQGYNKDASHLRITLFIQLYST